MEAPKFKIGEIYEIRKFGRTTRFKITAKDALPYFGSIRILAYDILRKKTFRPTLRDMMDHATLVGEVDATSVCIQCGAKFTDSATTKNRRKTCKEECARLFKGELSRKRALLRQSHRTHVAEALGRIGSSSRS